MQNILLFCLHKVWRKIGLQASTEHMCKVKNPSECKKKMQKQGEDGHDNFEGVTNIAWCF